jgi:hypothetical protein
MRRVSGVCRNCNHVFERPRAGGHDGAIFCGKSCAATYSNRRRPRCRVAQPPCKTCRQCGGRRSDTSRQGICRGCHKTNRLAELQTLTIGKLREQYGTAAFHAKLRGLSRSAYQGPMVCQECGYAKYVDVCHLRPVASFPPSATVAEVNAPHNLAAFCRNHHWEYDAGLLQSPIAQW